MIRKLATEYSVSEACSLLEVSCSGYYAWKDRAPCRRDRENEQLMKHIKGIHEASRKTYGIPRVFRSLRDNGIRCGKNRVARIMRENGIQGMQKARFRPRTTDSRHNDPISPNRFRDIGSIDRPNRVWVSDITYIPTREGWGYLAAVMDAGTRQIKGWRFKDTLKTDLISEAFLQAVFRHQPTPGLIFHSDRGCQYASEPFRNLLDEHHALGSMCATGNCYDNAAMESFWATLKNELNIKEPFNTREEANRILFDYIEVFYNRQRMHSSIGYRSPVDYECKIMRQNTAPCLSEISG